MQAARLLPRKVYGPCSKVQAPISYVVLLVLVYYPSTTKYSYCSSEKPLKVDLAKRANVNPFSAGSGGRWRANGSSDA